LNAKSVDSEYETQLSERGETIKSFREEILRMCSVLKQNRRRRKKIEESKGIFPSQRARY
jgi:hypothetical protein